VLESLVASGVVQLAASPLTIWWLYPYRHALETVPWRIAGWLAVVVVVLPVLLGLFWAHLSNMRGKDGAPRWRRTWPTGWDWLIDGRAKRLEGTYLIIEFNDGQRVAGCYAEESMAITSPDQLGIFLKPEWRVEDDGTCGEDATIDGSEGVLITDLSDVRLVRIMKGEVDGEATEP
jgi:hypothetical protein